jgi:hypothetical protein
VTWVFPSREKDIFGLGGLDDGYPWPEIGGVPLSYMNKCVDTVTGEWVYWETNYKDSNGTRYPGGGFDSATYRVEALVHGRCQL